MELDNDVMKGDFLIGKILDILNFLDILEESKEKLIECIRDKFYK